MTDRIVHTDDGETYKEYRLSAVACCSIDVLEGALESH